MGSFYATCSLSGMTLADGQPTTMLLLVPAFYGKRPLTEHKGLLVSNDGAQMFYSPFGFPIQGLYADYGNIDTIERDSGVELLEAYFGVSIEQILSAATDDRWIAYGDREGDTSWGLQEGGGNAGVLNREVLEQITCTYMRTEVYNYLKGSSAEQVGQYTEWLSKRPEANNTAFTPEQIAKAKSHEGEELSMEDVAELLEFMRSIQDGTRSWLGKGNDWKKHMYLHYIPQLTSVDMYKRLSLTGEHAQLCMEQNGFLRSMNDMGKLLMPSNYGTQQDNWKETLKFNVFCNRLLRANKGYWED